MGDNRKLIPDGPGWTCFHCNETFVSQGDAEDHFGDSGYEDSSEHNPACIERLYFSEKALRAGLMDMFRELEAERDVNDELETTVRELRRELSELQSSTVGAKG
jgi:hypothetical protein